jgi:LysR family transcriptional regulator, cyn operon transcriptional activator
MDQFAYTERIMNLRNLRTFVAVAESGGLTHGAERVRLSQPTVSRQVQALEQELGLVLFNRGGRGFGLTPEGEDLLHHARRVLIEVEAFQQRSRALTKGDTGLLRVGATPQVIEALLSGFLIDYRSRHPGVEVHLLEDGGARLSERLERGNVHVAIMPAGHDEFEAYPLFPMYAIAATPRSRGRKTRTVNLLELAGEPLLVLAPSFASRRWFDATCQQANIRPQIVMESAAPQTILALAADGHGIAIIPSTVPMTAHSLQFHPIVYQAKPIGRWATVARDPHRYLPQFGFDFVRELIELTRVDHPGKGVTAGARVVLRPPTTLRLKR